MSRYELYLIHDGAEGTPLLWEHPFPPSLRAYPGARLRLIGAFGSRGEAWRASVS